MSSTAAIITAAGSSRRMGFDKLQRSLNGLPLIAHTIRRIASVPEIGAIVLAVRPGGIARMQALVNECVPGTIAVIVEGGETRVHSVWNALQAVPAGTEIVAVHDGARPFVSVAAVQQCIAAARESGGAILAHPVTPTIKQADEALRVVRTLDRRTLWGAATPQCFRLDAYRAAYERLWASGIDVSTITDDARIFELAGGTVRIIPSNEENIKLTTALDWRLAELLTQ